MLYCYDTLGKVYQKQGKLDKALKYYFKVLKLALYLKDYTREL